MIRAVLLFTVLVSAPAAAQHHPPYAGQEQRAVKALSDEEAKQYLAGAGMGYARAAELNGYPGPMHVLELADKLFLTSEQRAATQKLMETHKAEARAVGAKRVAAEQALDELFRSGQADEKRVAEAVRAAAELEGQYRLSHLDTHVRMRALLTAHQVMEYSRLRGYGGAKQGH